MDRDVKIAERLVANIEMKCVMRVKIGEETLEMERVVVKQIENSAMKGVMPDANIAVRQVAVLTAVIM
jgi:hypothetical protein